MNETIAYAMTHTQRAIWAMQRLDPALEIFRYGHALTSDQALDRGLFTQAVRALLDRHEPLRTIFPVVAGRPVPQVLAKADIALVWQDAVSDSDGELSDRMMAEVRRPYNLERGPLTRFTVYERQNGQNVVLVASHHLATDLLSLKLILEELDQRYAALSAGIGGPMPPLPCSFSEFAAWANDAAEGAESYRHEAYWREQLRGGAPSLGVPIDHPRTHQLRHGESVRVEIPADQVIRLNEVARSLNSSLFSVLLASYAALLHRFSGAATVTIGSFSSGRTRRHFATMIGHLSTPIVVRVHFDPGTPFATLTRSVNRTVRGALRHQAYPVSLMAERIEPSSEPGRSPIFQAGFNLLHEAPILPGHHTWHGKAWEDVMSHNQEGHFELGLNTWLRRDGSLAAGFGYQTGLYDKTTAKRLGNAWAMILEQISNDPSLDVDTIRVLDRDDEKILTRDWNRTALPYPTDVGVHTLIREQGQRTPDAKAVSDEWDAITYKELAQRVHRLAARLQHIKVGPKCIVGVCLPPSIDQVVTLLAVMETGAAYLPLDPAHPRDRRNALLVDAGADIVVGNNRTLEGLSASSLHLISELNAQGQEDSQLELCPSGGDALAYVLFTSGSTGRPKGVAISHRSLVNVVWAMRNMLDIGSADTFLSITTLSFDIAALEIFLPLVCGAHVVMADRAVGANGLRLAREIEKHAATFVQATPTSWRLLQAVPDRPSRPVTRLVGGERLTRALADELLRDPGPIWNLYGPTETTIWSTASRVRPGNQAPPIGRPLANTQIYILDPYMQPVPLGVVGELWIGGDGVAEGYVGRPDLTAERFINDPFSERPGARLYRTGDLARWLVSGEVEFIGRTDHQVKIRGIRIELGEIETALLAEPDISEAVVIAIEVPNSDVRLHAYLLPKDGAMLQFAALRSKVRRRLPDYMIPTGWTVLEAMPLTANGKIDRRALLHSGPGEEERVPFVAPRTAIEAILARAASEVLKVERVGIDDDFFAIGGASLAIIELAFLAEEAGLAVTPEMVFESRTIRRLAELVQSAASKNLRANARIMVG